MRAVITPKGLSFATILRSEQAAQRRPGSVSPTPLKSIMKQQQIPSFRGKSKEGRTLSVNFRAATPSKQSKIRSRYQTLQLDRERIMRRIKRKAEETREMSQHCQLSFLDLDIRVPSPEKKREIQLEFVREEHNRKYAKVWSWLDTKSFSRPGSRYS